MESERRPRVVYMVTESVSVRLFGRLLEKSREHGYEVTVVASPGPVLEQRAAEAGVAYVGIPMAREIDIRKDV